MFSSLFSQRNNNIGCPTPSPCSGHALRDYRRGGKFLYERNYSAFPSVVFAVALFWPSIVFASDCLTLQQAAQHVGETKCVTGRVLKVKAGARGTHFLDFCEDQMACSFSVVVFSHDLKDVGDVRRLAGHIIEIHGLVKLYDGRPEIVLNHASQISGASTLLPPLPKNYDVENRGHYSAGRLRPTKKPAKTTPTPNSTATYGNEADADTSTEDPQ
jgi:hypothetical protein